MAKSDRTAFDDAMDRRKRQMELMGGNRRPEEQELRKLIRREIRRHERRRAIALLGGIILGIALGFQILPRPDPRPPVTITITEHPGSGWVSRDA